MGVLPPWDTSTSHCFQDQGSSLRILTGSERSIIRLGSRVRGEFVAANGDHDAAQRADRAWHITLKTRSGVQGGDAIPAELLAAGSLDGLGVLEQTCFVKRPSYYVRRPEPMAILHLLSEGGHGFWGDTLPAGWTELEISISSSREFCRECGVKYGGYLRRDIRAAMTQEDLPKVSGWSAGAKFDVVREMDTQGGLRVAIEFEFEMDVGAREGYWKLVDVVCVTRAPLESSSQSMSGKEAMDGAIQMQLV